MSTNRYNNSGAVGIGTTIDNMLSRAVVWTRYNQVGTLTTISALNVSSITDVGVGVGRPNYTAPMLNTGYVLSGVAIQEGSAYGAMNGVGYNAGNVQIASFLAWGASTVDMNNVQMVIHGPLA